MTLYKDIVEKKKSLALIGLGYVGMPRAAAFSKKINVIRFDLNKEKINLLKNGYDPTNEADPDGIKNYSVKFTYDENELKKVKIFIIDIPTLVNQNKIPDLKAIEGASTIVGRKVTKDSIVVYESIVYQGVTEDICIPILERESELKCGIDFKVGYSHERINPGDKVHTLENIKKIVSGMDEESLDTLAKVYELVIKAGVHRASSIKVAEAVQEGENSQMNFNIDFVNELGLVLDRMDIFTNEVFDDDCLYKTGYCWWRL